MQNVHPELSWKIIGCALKVHSTLGPGLLESAYEACLCHELAKAQTAFRRQVPVPLDYDGERIDCGFRIDVIVDDKVVVEVKSVAALAAVHEAQLLTYLRLTGLELGLLINFNAPRLKDGIKRRVLTPAASGRSLRR